MITERKLEILRNSSRPVRPFNFLTKFGNDIQLPGWNTDNESGRISSDGRKSGKGAADDNVVDDIRAKAPVDNAYADRLDVHPSGFGRRAAIILELSIDVGLSESSLSGDVSKLRGYLRGRLGLLGHPSLRRISYW